LGSLKGGAEVQDESPAEAELNPPSLKAAISARTSPFYSCVVFSALVEFICQLIRLSAPILRFTYTVWFCFIFRRLIIFLQRTAYAVIKHALPANTGKGPLGASVRSRRRYPTPHFSQIGRLGFCSRAATRFSRASTRSGVASTRYHTSHRRNISVISPRIAMADFSLLRRDNEIPAKC